MISFIGVIIAFAVIIILIRFKFNFGLSLLFGSLIVAIFSLIDNSIIDVFRAFSKAIIYDFDKEIFDFQTIELAILLTLIFLLAKTMQNSGAIQKVVTSLRTFFYRGGTLAVIPAVYGLMPVPGGALFSAPLVDEEGEKFCLNKDQKNFLNVWFRHIWFPIFPISSAMLLITNSDYSNIGLNELIIANFPSFIAFILIGYLFLRFYMKKNSNNVEKPEMDKSGLIYLIIPVIPILLYILFVIIIGFEEIKLFQTRVFIVGVILSIFALFFLLNIDWRKYLELLKKSFSIKLALVIIGIMVFRQMVEVSKANDFIASVISDLPIHPIFIILILPLLMGLITGYNLGAIALSYLLVEPFFEFTNINIIGLTSLVFMSALVGYLISPIHLCNVVSSEHLKTDTTRMYKMYIPASLSLLIVQTIFILIFY